MTWTDEQQQRVADAVKARREELGLTQEEAVDRAGGGVSKPVWSILENAHQSSYKPRTLAAVCRALSWTPRSLQRIAAGDEPELTPEMQGMITAIQNGKELARLLPRPAVVTRAEFDNLDEVVSSLAVSTTQLAQIVGLLMALAGVQVGDARIAAATPAVVVDAQDPPLAQ